MIAGLERFFYVRSIKRIPIEKRWGEDCVNWVQWAPWNRYKDAEDADGDIPEGVPIEEGAQIRVPDKVVYIETKSKVPRDFYIIKKDAEKHGITRGCAGCSSFKRGSGMQPHTEECRNRFRELMKEDKKLKNYEARQEDFKIEQEAKRKRNEDKAGKRKAESELVGEEGQESKVIVMEEERKRKAEDVNLEGQDNDGDVQLNLVEVIELIDKWVQEVQDEMINEEEFEAWDDVNGGGLPLKEVGIARKEEIDFMMKRNIWGLAPIEECWEKTKKAPVSVRWVDTNKGGIEAILIRSRLVARDSKGNDKDRDDLFLWRLRECCLAKWRLVLKGVRLENHCLLMLARLI